MPRSVPEATPWLLRRLGFFMWPTFKAGLKKSTIGLEDVPFLERSEEPAVVVHAHSAGAPDGIGRLAARTRLALGPVLAWFVTRDAARFILSGIGFVILTASQALVPWLMQQLLTLLEGGVGALGSSGGVGWGASTATALQQVAASELSVGYVKTVAMQLPLNASDPNSTYYTANVEFTFPPYPQPSSSYPGDFGACGSTAELQFGAVQLDATATAAIIIAAMAAAFIGQFIGSALSWIPSNLMGYSSQVVLTVVAAIKGLLLAPGQRSGGEQQAVLSRYAPILANGSFFGNLHADTWAPLVFISIAMYNLVYLLGAAAWVAFGVQAACTIAAFASRSYFRKMDRKSNVYAVKRLGLLKELLTQLPALRATGWDEWYCKRIEVVRAKEVALLRRAQMVRVVVDVAFALMQAAVLISAFLAYAAINGTDKPLSPTVAFTSITWVSAMNSPMKAIPAFVQAIADTQAFMQRLQENARRGEVEMGAVQSQWRKQTEQHSSDNCNAHESIQVDTVDADGGDGKEAGALLPAQPYGGVTSAALQSAAFPSPSFTEIATELRALLEEAAEADTYTSRMKHGTRARVQPTTQTGDRAGSRATTIRNPIEHGGAHSVGDDDGALSLGLLIDTVAAAGAGDVPAHSHAVITTSVRRNPPYRPPSDPESMAARTAGAHIPVQGPAMQVDNAHIGATVAVAPSKASSAASNDKSAPKQLVSSSSDPTSNSTSTSTLRLLLRDINLTCPRGSLTIVIGSTGAGKSMLLKSMVGDAVVVSGRVNVEGSVAYVGQEPWLQRGSVRDNICFQSAYRPAWYSEVVAACALNHDFEQWAAKQSTAVESESSGTEATNGSDDGTGSHAAAPLSAAGDDLLLSDDGVNVSGGQRQRIALARALYCDANCYIIDDVFSALDPVVGDHVWKHAISGLLLGRGKTVILATHGLQYLSRREVGNIVVLGKGDQRLALIQEQQATAQLHLEPVEQVIAGIDSSARDTASVATVIASGSFEQLGPLIADESRRLAVMRGGTDDTTVADAGGSLAASTLAPSTCEGPTDTRGNTNKPNRKAKQATTTTATTTTTTTTRGSGSGMDALDKQSESLVTWLGIRTYISSIGYAHGVTLLLLYILSQAVSVGQAWWLKVWAEQQQDQYGVASGNQGGAAVYGTIGAAFALLSAMRMLMLALATTHAGKMIHDSALRGLVSAPSSFFSRTQSGEILNRFERDVDHIDAWVRPNISIVAVALFSLLGSLCIVAYATPWVLIWIAIVSVAYAWLGKLYRAVVMKLRSLDASSNSGTVTFWKEIQSSNGSTVIRSLGPRAAAISVLRLLERMETMITTRVASYAGSMLAGMLLSATGNTITLAAAIVAVVLHGRGDLSAGDVGLLLSYAYTFPNDISSLIQNIGYLEQSAVSIQRISEYVHLEGEDVAHARVISMAMKTNTNGRKTMAAVAVPGAGTGLLDHRYLHRNGDRRCTDKASSLTIKGLALRYEDEQPPPRPPSSITSSSSSASTSSPEVAVTADDMNDASAAAASSGPIDVAHPTSSARSGWALHGLDLHIPAGCKVAVIGRTGAGKSSIVQALLRMYPYQAGSIHMDGKDLGTIASAREVRSSFGVLMQAGLVFEGSVRDNLLGPWAEATATAASVGHARRHQGSPSSSSYQGVVILDADGGEWDDERILSFIHDQVSPLLAAKIRSMQPVAQQAKASAAAQSDVSGVNASTAIITEAGSGGSCLDVLVTPDGDNLSKGEKALLSVARLLLQQELECGKRGILIMDEPSADIDVDSDRQLHNAILTRRETLLCICHRREHIHKFDLVARIENGCCVSLGPPNPTRPHLSHCSTLWYSSLDVDDRPGQASRCLGQLQ